MFRTPILIGLFFLPSFAVADVTIAPIFSDGVILQQSIRPVIWGRADPGEEVVVSLGSDMSEAAVTDKNGDWSVSFGILQATAKPRTLSVTGKNKVEVNDVLVGNVYIAGGQSNMAMRVGDCAKAVEEIKKIASESDYPLIRFASIKDGPSREPLTWLRSQPKWTKCSPETVSGFSAAAFFFARRIHLELKTSVPIGIIDVSRGGTPIEPFIPRSAFVGHPTLEREAELGDKNDLESLCRLPGGVRARDANWLPGQLFHSRLSPLAHNLLPRRGFHTAGAIWYQGESNSGVMEDPRDYQFKMKALITSWQSLLIGNQSPFCFVQLPGSGAGPNWPYLREQQRLASLESDNVGMAVTIDLENPDIHPPNKLDVGERMAAFLLTQFPEHEVRSKVPSFSGPVFDSAKTIGNKIAIGFTHRHRPSELMIAEKNGTTAPVETPDGTLNHFEVLDTDGMWHKATAAITGINAIEVKAPDVEQPVAARYAYAVAPSKCNLYSREGFPASPFCTQPELLKIDPGLPK